MHLTEAFNIDEVVDKEQTPTQLFLGRLQPPHNGHAKILKQMSVHGWVAIVKGVGTGLDKVKNPLPYAYQAKLVKEIAPEIKIIEVPTGYLPDIINQIRLKGEEVRIVYAGADRIEDYKRQVNGANAKLPEEKQFNVQFRLADRVTSATMVRDAIRSNNQSAFRANVPREIWGEYKTLRNYLGEGVNVKTFGQFLQEAIDPATMSVFNDEEGLMELVTSGGRSFDFGEGGRTDKGYSGGRSGDWGAGGRSDKGYSGGREFDWGSGGRTDEDMDDLDVTLGDEMTPSAESLPESQDPNATKLSGGRGDKKRLDPAKTPDNAHQISDVKKPQLANTANFIKKI